MGQGGTLPSRFGGKYLAHGTFTRQEHPNIVSGLNAKRDELLAYRKALHAEAAR